jgi:HAMP domain-containing protein
MKDNFIMIAIGVVVIAVLAIGGYFSFVASRWINYNLSYHSMVVDSIKEEVKAECLVNPSNN